MAITETNQQYYQGSQGFRGNVGNDPNQEFLTTFDTSLVLGSLTSWSPTDANYGLNNFKAYTSTTGLPGSWSEWVTQMLVTNNTITLVAPPGANIYIVVQLTTLDGGQYATTLPEEARGEAVEENYGSYQYVKLRDIIDNYMVGYVGDGKIIQTAKKSDVLFFAKRSLQEFSYDTLKRPLYPNNNLTINPYQTPLQDQQGQPTQDSFGENLEGESITIERWRETNANRLLNGQALREFDNLAYDVYGDDFGSGPWNWGRLYGLDPQYSNVNGWFGINEREGKFTFSSNLRDRLIVLEYISDGLAYDLDTRVPKMAEEAMYLSISYNILANRSAVPEGMVARFKKDKRAALRNAKIRLSNIKLEEIVQVMRGQSKWIKH